MSPTLPTPPSRWHWGWALVIVALGLLAYSGVILDGGWIWDDDNYVTRRPVVQDPGGLGPIWFDTVETPQYYPLVFTTLWLEWRLWGDDPTGYHIVNIVLHLCSVLVLWRILVGLGVPGAWFAAALFALHPVEVESVAWITERKNTLSGLCYLLSAWFFLRFAGVWGQDDKDAGVANESSEFAVEDAEPEVATEASPRWGLLIASALLFVGGLLSKTVIASLPAALLLVLLWKRGWRLPTRVWASLAAMLVVGAYFGLQTAQLEVEHVGAEGAEFDFSVAERILIAGRAVWFYAGKLVFPYPLTFFYERWELNAGELVQWIFPIGALLLLLLAALARKRIGVGPLVALLIFGGTLFPALGFVDVFPFRFSFVADHFQYHASIAFLVLLAAAGTRIPIPALAKTATGALVLVVLATLTFLQGRMYAGEKELWQANLEVNPDSWAAWHNLGHYYAKQGLHEKALEHYDEGLDRYRDFMLLTSAAQAQLELAKNPEYTRRGVAEAERLLLEALTVREDWPWTNLLLAQIYDYTDGLDQDRRIRYFEQALGAMTGRAGELAFQLPEWVTARQALAQAYFQRGRQRGLAGESRSAIGDFEQAVHWDEQLGTALVFKGWILAAHEEEEFRDPEAALQLALDLQQRFGTNLAQAELEAAARAALGDYAKAVQVLEPMLPFLEQQGLTDRVAPLTRRLDLYRANKPYRSATGFPD